MAVDQSKAVKKIKIQKNRIIKLKTNKKMVKKLVKLFIPKRQA